MNKIKIQSGLLYVAFMFLSSLVWGQASEKYKGEYANFYRAEELFEKEQYSAAREVFAEFLTAFENPEDPHYIKAKYYEGLAALELYNGDAIRLLLDFNNEYPENIYKNTIYFKIGEDYYQRKKYKDAKSWLEKTDYRDIDTSYLSAYHFKLGYSYFQLEEYKKARNEFYEVKDGSSNYSAPALYYYSYIAYQNKAYQEALEGFLVLKDNSAFEKEAPYYVTQIYYLMGNYDKVTEYAPEFNDDEKEIAENTAGVNLLIGDAYYQTRQYEKAAPYLEDYNRRKATTRDEDYALGYTYFQTKKYKNAVSLFDRVTSEEDRLTQSAYYHIAEAYLKQEELNYARSAFRSASKYDFNPSLQEDALYNYAVLSYQLDYNPYDESIRAFEDFLQKFPDSDRKEDVYSYLVNVYSTTKNYKEAIQSLDRIPNKNTQLKVAYQVVAYNQGIEKYELGDYEGSVKSLKMVAQYSIDPAITGKAKFWEADANYMQKNWSEAVVGYRAFLHIPGVNSKTLREAAYYNIAYAYFMQEDWAQAIESFRTFTKLGNIQDERKLSDAYARIGDAYYTRTSPDFEKSAMNYEKALEYEGGKKDELLFGLAKVYKLQPSKRAQQISTLNRLLDDHPNSSYRITAIYEVGRAYKNDGNFSEALRNFQQILKNHGDNILAKNAMVEIADVKYKQKKYEESESYFRRALNEYALDDEMCKRVTQGIIDIYRDTRQQEKIEGLREKYACAGISEDDEEIFYYETASELYVNDEYDEAIPEIEKYLKRYPQGRFSTQLRSYIADIYYQREETETALKYYEEIADAPTSSYSVEALVRLSKVLYNQEKYERALPYYTQLEKISSDPKVLLNTRVGLMRTNYLLKQYEEANKAAKKVIDSELLDDEGIETEGSYIAGMSYFKMEKYEAATPYLHWITENTSKERGTEALFVLAECYFYLKDYEKAEELHNQLLQRKPAYDYWIAKSLILQTKVFVQTDDLYQAEETINSVLYNYPEENDGIIDEAEDVKAELLQLKDAPKDVEDDSLRMIDINDEDDE